MSAQSACLLVDLGSRIGVQIGQQFLQRGAPVWAHVRDTQLLPPGFFGADGDSAAAAVEQGLSRHEGIRTVVFDLPVLDEQALLEADRHAELCEQVQRQSLWFLLALQTAVKRLMTRAPAQIWVLVREDSFRYHLDVPASPILAQLRMSTVRTVAKEVARFGLRMNVAVLHFGAEELPPDVWRAGREGLKCYAQKYKPFAVADMAAHLVTMACNPALPVHGAVMQIGNGVLENNI